MAQHWHEAMPPSSSDLNLCLMVGVTARYATAQHWHEGREKEITEGEKEAREQPGRGNGGGRQR